MTLIQAVCALALLSLVQGCVLVWLVVRTMGLSNTVRFLWNEWRNKA